jgi:hypothetical protein
MVPVAEGFGKQEEEEKGEDLKPETGVRRGGRRSEVRGQLGRRQEPGVGRKKLKSEKRKRCELLICDRNREATD